MANVGWQSLAAEAELRWPTPGPLGGAPPDVLMLDEDGHTLQREGGAVLHMPSGTPGMFHVDMLLPPPPAPSGLHPGARPASPSSVEKMASLLRSISFVAGRPRTGSAAEEASRIQAYDTVAWNLRNELGSESIGRMAQVAPHLVSTLEAALLSSAGVLLGAEGAPRAFEWARDSLDALRSLLPTAEVESVLPGQYYREILEADVAQLSQAVATAGRELERRLAIRTDVLAVIARPASGAAELAGVSKVASQAGLHPEAAAAAQAAEVSRGLTMARSSAQAAEDDSRAAKRDAADAKAALKRERREADDARKALAQAEDERNALRVQLTQEVETRRRVEAASIKTLEQLKLGEEARWAAERTLQAEKVRCDEIEVEMARLAEDASDKIAAADRQIAEMGATAATEGNRYLEAERRVVALSSRVQALEGVQAQLEQQLQLERDACAEELSLRQASERKLAEATHALRVARQAADAAEGARAGAAAVAAKAADELAAAEERLRVANEHNLQGHLEAASTDETIVQLQRMREDDAERIAKLNVDKADLGAALKGAEARIASEAAAAQRAAKEAGQRQYALQTQLTDLARRLEAVQVEAARAQLLLEHEKSAGSSAQDEGSRLTAALAEERRVQQRLAQELAAERALRTRAEESGTALQREAAAARRQADLAAQGMAQLEAEVQLARTEASEAAGVLQFAESAQRERETLHREQRERAAFERQQAQQRRTNGSGASGPTGATGAHAPPHLVPHSDKKVNFAADYRGGVGNGLNTTRENAYATDDDELAQSDLWNFSSGRIGRGGSGRPARNQAATPSITLPHIKGAMA